MGDSEWQQLAAPRGVYISLLKRLKSDFKIEWPEPFNNSEVKCFRGKLAKQYGKDLHFILRRSDFSLEIFSAYPATYLYKHGFKLELDSNKNIIWLLPAGLS